MEKGLPRVVADVVTVHRLHDSGETFGVKVVPKTVINDPVLIIGTVGE